MTKTTGDNDAQIQQAVLRELKWDTRVKETDVGVEVSNGIVTLTGTVPSWPKRAAAQAAAHRVAGVLDVANDISVKFSGAAERSDTELAQAIRNALEWDVSVPDSRIRSTVSRGHVTLDGDVDSWHEREDAETAVENLSGVRSVYNRIAVKPPKLAEPELRQSIASALERRAHREAQHLAVRVNDGEVTLSGIVSSFADKQAVLGTVRGTLGVESVKDELTVDLASR